MKQIKRIIYLFENFEFLSKKNYMLE